MPPDEQQHSIVGVPIAKMLAMLAGSALSLRFFPDLSLSAKLFTFFGGCACAGFLPELAHHVADERTAGSNVIVFLCGIFGMFFVGVLCESIRNGALYRALSAAFGESKLGRFFGSLAAESQRRYDADKAALARGVPKP